MCVVLYYICFQHLSFIRNMDTDTKRNYSVNFKSQFKKKDKQVHHRDEDYLEPRPPRDDYQRKLKHRNSYMYEVDF